MTGKLTFLIAILVVLSLLLNACDVVDVDIIKEIEDKLGSLTAPDSSSGTTSTTGPPRGITGTISTGDTQVVAG